MSDFTTMQTQPKAFCFVLMPFAEEFNDIYEFGIKGACTDAETYCERVDEQIYEGSVLERIYNQISRADIVIADMTGRSANVFYKVGYAHALGKPTILLTQNSDDIPFDLKHFPHIVYQAKIRELRKELTERVKWFAEHPRKPSEYKLGIEVYHNKEALSTGAVVCKYSGNQSPNGQLTFHNASSETYLQGSFRVGIITPAIYKMANYMTNKETPLLVSSELPNGSYLHMFPEFETLFPDAYCSAGFWFIAGSNKIPKSDNIIIRIFSPAGRRDFPLQLLKLD